MSGISKTKEQRNNFSSQGETFQMLVQFMESLAQVAKEIRNGVNNLKPGLTKLFNKYSYDGVSMTSNDIFNMVTELSNQYGAYDDFTEDTADFIIQALDVDFNGTIEVDEWSDWIMRGAAKSVYARKRFSQTNQAFQNLGYFLDYIVVVAKQISPPEEGGNDDDDTLRKSDVVEAKSSVPKVNSILQQQRDRIRKNEVLKTKVSAFASLSDDHLNSIIDTMTFEEHDDDNPLIIEQGKVADRLYVVLAGEVSIMAATGTEGWPTEKCRIGELEVFGNEALLMIDNLRYSISGVACDDVQLLCLTIANNPMFGDKAQEIVEASRKQRAADITKRVGKQLAMKFRASRK
jgi:CRP-like cAMP-binding protein